MIECKELTLTEFSRALSDKVSVPGGGGAAAYNGAMGCGLLAMAARFTVGKKKFLEYTEDLERIIKSADLLREEFEHLVEEDAANFEPLAAAYKIDKDDPKREWIIDTAVDRAAQSPLRMVQAATLGIALAEELKEKCSKMMISDVACGVMLLKSAMEAASVNVYINTTSLKDREKAREMEKSCDAWLAEYSPRAAQLSEDIIDNIRGLI